MTHSFPTRRSSDLVVGQLIAEGKENDPSLRRCAMASQRWVDLWVKEEITRSALRCRRLKRTLLQIFSASASYKVMRQLGGLHNPVPQFRADSATGRF